MPFRVETDGDLESLKSHAEVVVGHPGLQPGLPTVATSCIYPEHNPDTIDRRKMLFMQTASLFKTSEV